jgi:site-specific recombinase XerD
MTHKFIYFCEKAELVGFKLHGIRHTHATKLIDAGVDVLTVSKLLGHADIKTTMIYAKVQRPVLESAIRSLELSMQPMNQKLLPAKAV